ncbi:MAG: hypothetical protein JNK72_18245 [Myxococcales bacterium]|nr:hypothetical protein [Myxococcales bacterium]
MARRAAALALVTALGCTQGAADEPTPTPTPTPSQDAGGAVTADVPVLRPRTVQEIPGHESIAQDTAPKEAPRLVPVEALMRSYMTLFGGLSPLQLQTRLRGSGGNLFDTWNDYLSALGVPDYAADIPRNEQTNALMLAAFERIGVALCDRAVESDLAAMPPTQKVVFRFDLPANRAVTDAEFATRFDVLHRLFFGYPASLAPPERLPRFRQLLRDAAARRATQPANAPGFNATRASWAVVCYAFVRHPEFHLY